MVSAQRCSAPECTAPATTTLEGRELCEEHFIAAAYRFLDEAAIRLRHSSYEGSAAAKIGRELDECMRATTRMAMSVSEPNNLARARLIDILLWAAELSKQVRRGPRTEMVIAVVLVGSTGGETWEEPTKTNTVSRRGASLSCKRALETGDVVNVKRLDTGQHGAARVVWVSRKDSGNFEVGVELLSDQDLWGIDWNVSAEAGPHVRSDAGAN
jgi:hypothetical protein